jgi:hypothetical protein
MWMGSGIGVVGSSFHPPQVREQVRMRRELVLGQVVASTR